MSSPSTAPSATMPSALIGFVSLVSVLGFAVIGHASYNLFATPYPIGWLSFGVLALLAGSFALKVPGVPVYLSMSDTFFITSALLFGPAPATLTIALDSLFISVRNKKNAPHQTLFNTTSLALSLWIAAHAFFAIAGTGPLAGHSAPPDVRMMLGLVSLATLYFLFNSGLIATAVSLQKGVPGLTLWRDHFAIVSLSHFAAASASFFFIVLMRFVSPIAIVAIVPLLVIFYLATRSWLGRLADAERYLAEVNRLHLSTVSALSTAIEAKDGVTSDHIHRVQAYAMGLARALSITDSNLLQAIEAAALLHDTGKLAVPEHILNKPGALTPAEFDTMKLHVDVGADILSAIDFPYPVVPIVEAHHENWDGSGYPAGLAGADIPIGARILSVVDCFDALTSSRPYRPALSAAAAMDIIRDRRGTFYDPAVVDTFVRVYRDIAPARPQPKLQDAVRRIRRLRASDVARTPALERAAAADAPATSSDELLAFVSLARLASRTPTLADIGALAWAHLRQLMPGTTLALFTVDPSRRLLVAEYCAGRAGVRLSGTAVEMGQRVTGWAAVNARAMLNANAALDLVDGLADDLRFALALPLVADGEVVGVMTFYAANAFTDDQSRSLEMIAPHLASAVASAVGVTRSPTTSAVEARVFKSAPNRGNTCAVSEQLH